MSTYKRIKLKAFEVVDQGKESGKFSNYFDDYFIMGLIVLSVLAIILESFEELHKEYYNVFHYFDIFTISVFTFEYLIRFWTAEYKYYDKSILKSKIKYVLSPFGLIDLFAIIPFYLPLIFTMDLRFIRIIRLTRLFRIFKLGRYSKSLNSIKVVLAQKHAELGVTLFFISLLLLICSTLMYYIEHDAQPDKFPNIIASFWWAIVTLTTIGYGDVFPITTGGQILAGITALLGIGLVAIPTGIISSGFMSELQKQKEEDEKPAPSFCPHCGKKL